MTLRFMAKLICNSCRTDVIVRAGDLKDRQAAVMSIRATVKKYHQWSYENVIDDGVSHIKDYCPPCARARGIS